MSTLLMKRSLHYRVGAWLLLVLVSASPTLTAEEMEDPFGEGSQPPEAQVVPPGSQNAPKTGTLPQHHPNGADATPLRLLAVLPSTDSSPHNLGKALQYAMFQLFQSTGLFQVQASDLPLPGFSAGTLLSAFENVGTELLSFAYLEKERISLFLFDSFRPKEFVVVSQALTDPTGGQAPAVQVIEYNLRLAFTTLMSQFSKNRFAVLPGEEIDPELKEKEEAEEMARLSKEGQEKRKAQRDEEDRVRSANALESKTLFDELSKVQARTIFLGANFGMARFAGQNAAASTVSFGFFSGFDLRKYGKFDLGIDISSYALGHVDYRFYLTLPKKYVALGIGLGAGYVISAITENLGFESSTITPGELIYGPGLTFDIPMMGINIRTELRYYTGGNGNSFLVGTYGLSYTI